MPAKGEWEGRTVVTGLGLLKSYDNMGFAELRCQGACQCEEQIVNCTTTSQVCPSLHALLSPFGVKARATA